MIQRQEKINKYIFFSDIHLPLLSIYSDKANIYCTDIVLHLIFTILDFFCTLGFFLF